MGICRCQKKNMEGKTAVLSRAGHKGRLKKGEWRPRCQAETGLGGVCPREKQGWRRTSLSSTAPPFLHDRGRRYSEQQRSVPGLCAYRSSQRGHLPLPWHRTVTRPTCVAHTARAPTTMPFQRSAPPNGFPSACSEITASILNTVTRSQKPKFRDYIMWPFSGRILATAVMCSQAPEPLLELVPVPPHQVKMTEEIRICHS